MDPQQDSPTPELPSGNPTPEVLPPSPVNDVEANKDMAALSYAWVLSVAVYFAKRDSAFVRFHARQGMVLFALSVLFWMIPIVGRFLELLVLAFCVIGFLAAAQGEWKELPIVGPISKGDWKNLRSSWRGLTEAVAKIWRQRKSTGKEQPAPSESQPPPPPPSAPIV